MWETSFQLLYLKCQIDLLLQLISCWYRCCYQVWFIKTIDCIPQVWRLSLRSGHLHIHRRFLRSGEGCQSTYWAKVWVTCLVYVPHSVTTTSATYYIGMLHLPWNTTAEEDLHGQKVLSDLTSTTRIALFSSTTCITLPYSTWQKNVCVLRPYVCTWILSVAAGLYACIRTTPIL